MRFDVKSLFGARQRAAKKPPRQRPRVEELEGRLVPATVFALSTTNGLFTFDSASPQATSAVTPVTGLAVNEQLEGIDFRPSDGKLYALGRIPGTTTLRL